MAASLPIQSLPPFLRQPMTVAVLASLAIHGLVGMSFSATRPQAPAPKPGVGVVELSPLEQARLPQSVTQAPLPLPTTVPPLPNTPLSPNFRSTNPALPDNSLYTIPYAPPPPIPWYWNPPLRQAAPGTQARRSPAQPRSQTRPLQSQTPARQFPTTPQSGQQYTIGEGIKFGNPETPTAPQQPTSRTRPDKIAATAVEQLRQLQQQKRQGTETAGTGTSTEEAIDLLSQWLAKVDNPVAQQNIQRLSLVAQTTAPQAAEAVSVAVLVDAQGKIVGEPELIQSSATKALNQAALETVKAHGFQPTPTDQVYLIRVEFNPQASVPTRTAG